MISIVINYCSNDERFIRVCLDNALKVSTDIIVPVSDHFFDGTPESIEKIKSLAKEYPLVNFQVYEWTPDKFPRYWHNMSRIIGQSLCNKDSDYILFLDSDEIIDPELFNQFLANENFTKYHSYKFLCYWYFREPIYQATVHEATPVLVRKEFINIDPFNTGVEREQMFEYLSTDKKINCVEWNGVPMFHHFSWVRTKEQMLKKVKSWGHASDKNWSNLVEEEFSRPFNGTDFVHGYQYNIVENKFGF